MTIATLGDAFSYDDGTGVKASAKLVGARLIGADGSGAASTSNPVPITPYGAGEYETVAASQSDQVLGATGAVGDYLESLIIVVATAATAQVQIKDGNGSAITVFPNSPGSGIGTYVVRLGLRSVNATTPGWKVTTGAGSSVIGIGNFT